MNYFYVLCKSGSVVLRAGFSTTISMSMSTLPKVATALLKEQAFVNGRWCNAFNSATFAVLNPANGETVGHVPDMNESDTTAAVEAAQSAFLTWKTLTPADRGVLLNKWAALITERTEELAHLMTIENGKPLAEARGEVAYGSSFINWFAEEGKRIHGQTLPGPWPNKRLFTVKQPQGVCALITPWNFPIAMITRKAGAAMAAGCTVVIKPAEDTPLSALAICQLAHEVGIPPGVINVVTASRKQAPAVGGVLTSHPFVKHVSFTGSTKTGKILLQQSASTVKRCSMELGGNAPFIVFNSANLRKAVDGAVISRFRNSGQTCVCANRILVQSEIYDEFVKEAVDTMQRQLKVGDGLESGVTQGPLINKEAVHKMKVFMKDAESRGAQVLLGGKEASVGNGKGFFFEPTVVTGLDSSAQCFKEEIFGPILAVFKFETEAEAVKLANDVDVGLAGYFYSEDVSQCWRVAEALNTGMVGINDSLISTCYAPFSGWNESGLGKEGGVGYGIEEYVNVKYMCLNMA